MQRKSANELLSLVSQQNTTRDSSKYASQESLTFLKDKAPKFYLERNSKHVRDRFVRDILEKLECGSYARSEWASFHTPSLRKPKWLSFHAGVTGGVLDSFLVDDGEKDPTCFMIDLCAGERVAKVLRHNDNVRVGRNGVLVNSDQLPPEESREHESQNVPAKEVRLGKLSLSWEDEFERNKASIRRISSDCKFGEKKTENFLSKFSGRCKTAGDARFQTHIPSPERSISAPGFRQQENSEEDADKKSLFILGESKLLPYLERNEHLVHSKWPKKKRILRSSEGFPQRGVSGAMSTPKQDVKRTDKSKSNFKNLTGTERLQGSHGNQFRYVPRDLKACDCSSAIRESGNVNRSFTRAIPEKREGINQEIEETAPTYSGFKGVTIVRATDFAPKTQETCHPRALMRVKKHSDNHGKIYKLRTEIKSRLEMELEEMTEDIKDVSLHIRTVGKL